MYPFIPVGGSVDLAASTSSARVALPTGDPGSLRITNPGSVTVYVTFGTSTVTATTTAGMDLPPGTVESFRVPTNATHIAGITASGTATIRLTPGQGL